MNHESLQPAILQLAYERTLSGALVHIVGSLSLQRDVALARIWMLEMGEPCDEDPVPTGMLRLVASDGRPRDGNAERTRRLDGDYQYFKMGDRKVGQIAETGEAVFLVNLENENSWMRDPDWGRREGIKSFAGQPLIFRGEVLGVLVVFSREILESDVLETLRHFADHAAAALSNARAFEEIECLRSQLELENEYLREEVMEVHSHGEILGDSAALSKVLQQIDLVARTDSTVLIEGESGTGKELIARAIHERSDRSERPMIKVNCASISRELFESEFFGHVKGSFTGAIKDRVGRFELADGGTLFLDEVGEIPLELQGKLLRVLQEGEFQRVGDEATREVDVRVIAASNRNLKKESDAGAFRQDLYFRLSVFPIESPPLRDRSDDIAVLASHFLERAAEKFRMPRPLLKKRHVQMLQRYSWPDNVRELQNVMERAVITGQQGGLLIELPETEGIDDAVLHIAGAEPDKTGTVLTYPEFRDFERENIRRALEQCGWKVAGKRGAAELLEANPTTLASRIKRLGIVQ